MTFFKRFISSCLLMTFLTVQANAGTQNSLKKVFDEFNYSITVEWDQKDKVFYDAQVEKLNQKLKDLREAGVSQSEMVNFALNEVKNESLKKELQTAMSLLHIGAIGEKEANEMIAEAFKKSQMSGASWNGGTAVLVIVLVAFVALVIYASTLAPCNEGEVEADEYICEDVCITGDDGYRYCREECGNVRVCVPAAAI